MPLGVCVNCAAPIAKGLYAGGARAEIESRGFDVEGRVGKHVVDAARAQVTDTSHQGGSSTVVSSLALLFAPIGSTVSEVTLTLLVMRPGVAGAVTAMVTIAVPPAKMVPRVQVGTPPAGLSKQPELGTKVVPAGSVSVTTTFVAV